MLRAVCMVVLVLSVGAHRPGEEEEKKWTVSVGQHNFQHLDTNTYQGHHNVAAYSGDLLEGMDASKKNLQEADVKTERLDHASNRASALVEKNTSMALVSRTSLHLSLQGEGWGEFKAFMDKVALKFVATVNDGLSVLQGAVSDLPILLDAVRTFSGNITGLANTIKDDRVAGMISDSLKSITGSTFGANLTGSVLAFSGLVSAVKDLVESWGAPLNNACECLNQLARRQRIIAVFDVIMSLAAVLSDGNVRALITAVSGPAAPAIMPFLVVGGAISRMGAMAMKAWGTPFLAMWEVKCASECPDDSTTVSDADVAAARIANPKGQVVIGGKGFPIEMPPTATERETYLTDMSTDLGNVFKKQSDFYKNFRVLDRDDSVMKNLSETLHGVGGSNTNAPGPKERALSNAETIVLSHVTQDHQKADKTMRDACVKMRNACALWGASATVSKEEVGLLGGGSAKACTMYQTRCLNMGGGTSTTTSHNFRKEGDPANEWYKACCEAQAPGTPVCKNTVTAETP